MLLTAQQSSASGSPTLPPQFLERATQLLSRHKAVRLVPEDEAVTIEEAAELLDTFPENVRGMLKLGSLKRCAKKPNLIRLEEVLKYKRDFEEHMKSPVAQMFKELYDMGLYD